MMPKPLLIPRRPNHLSVQHELPSNPVCAELSISTEPRIDIINIFRDIRHLTATLNSIGPSIMLSELKPLERAGASIMYRLLSLEVRKSKQQMTDLDYLYEACRLAALIFVKRVFHGFWPRCPVIARLKCQLKESLLEKESRPLPDILPHAHPEYYTWALVMGGIHSLEYDDISFFAKRIAVSTQIWQAIDIGGWPGILSCVKSIAWIYTLDGPVCEAFGARVAECIRSCDAVWDHALEELALKSWPVV